MSKSPLVRIRSIYKILLSVSILIAGLCLIAGCLYIYYSGNGYTREIVTETFATISIPIYICLAFVIGDMIWELISPTDNKQKSFKPKSQKVDTPKNANKKSLVTKFVILGIAISVMIFGLLTGGYADVLTKAINICTECIGLG